MGCEINPILYQKELNKLYFVIFRQNPKILSIFIPNVICSKGIQNLITQFNSSNVHEDRYSLLLMSLTVFQMTVNIFGIPKKLHLFLYSNITY